jgi:hypothetical protein
MTRSQLHKLGDRLKSSERPTPDDLVRLHEVLMAYDGALSVVERVLGRLTVEIDEHQLLLSLSTRTKTTATTIDKLQRGTALDRMQDLAGARLVLADGGRWEKDVVVAAVTELFDSPVIHDRRSSPTHGYRAVSSCRVRGRVARGDSGTHAAPTSVGGDCGEARRPLGATDQVRPAAAAPRPADRVRSQHYPCRTLATYRRPLFGSTK